MSTAESGVQKSKFSLLCSPYLLNYLPYLTHEIVAIFSSMASWAHNREIIDIIKHLPVGKDSVIHLLKALGHPDIVIQDIAILHLNQLDNSIVKPVILESLMSEDVEIKTVVAKAVQNIELSNLGEDSVPYLLQVLEHPNINIQNAAATLLGKIDGETALNAVKDKDYNVRKSAVEAICHAKGESHLPTLLRIAKDPDLSIRIIAINRIGEVGNEAALPVLLNAMKSLASRQVNTWHDSQFDYARSTSEQVIHSALSKLNLTNTSLPYVVESLKYEDSEQWQLIRQLFSQIMGSIKLPSILDAPEYDIESCQLEEDELVFSLLEAICYQAWESCQGSSVISDVLTSLEHEDWQICQSAAKLLWKIGGREVARALVQALERIEDWDVRQWIAEAIGLIQDEAVIPDLLKLLQHPHWEIRWSAAEALTYLFSDQAIPGLIEALEHENWDVRRNAAEVLVNFRSKQIIPGLFKALADEHEDVRRVVQQALIREQIQITDLTIEPWPDEEPENPHPYCQKRDLLFAMAQNLGESAIPGLIATLDVEDPKLGVVAILARLTHKAPETAISDLWHHHRYNPTPELKQTIQSLQKSYKRYNPTLATTPLGTPNSSKSQR